MSVGHLGFLEFTQICQLLGIIEYCLLGLRNSESLFFLWLWSFLWNEHGSIVVLYHSSALLMLTIDCF